MRLVELADRRPETPAAAAETELVSVVRAGGYDVAFQNPSGLHALLAEYRGPERRGTVGIVEWIEPRHLRPAGAFPEYPAIAKMARVTGKVVLDLTLDDTGAVREARVSAGIPLLDSSSLTAARAWRFQREAAPRDEPLRVVLDFKLEHCAILD